MLRLVVLVHVFFVTGYVFAQSPLGFRTDGTGRYPDANPPLHWGLDKSDVWKVNLTQSNAIPVILGQKLLTCAEPCVLICVNKADGQVLWQGESSFKEIVLTDQEKALFEIERQQAEELYKQQSALDKEASALRKALRDGLGRGARE